MGKTHRDRNVLGLSKDIVWFCSRVFNNIFYFSKVYLGDNNLVHVCAIVLFFAVQRGLVFACVFRNNWNKLFFQRT